MPAPAPHSDYPTIADLKLWLNSGKIIVPDDVTLQNKLDWAITQYETAIGRKALAVNKTYNLPINGQRRQTLPQSCLSLSSVAVFGNAYLSGTDFDLMSVDGGPPYEWIEFTNALPWGYAVNNGVSARKGLAITGLFGLDTTVPPIAWAAMIAGAFILLIPEIAAAVSLGRAKLDAGEQSEYFNIRGDGGPYDNEAKWAQAAWNTGVQAYQRVTVGL